MNIYLDIDGVLLQKDGKPAQGLQEFLSYVTTQCACYWLTTHCKGDAAPVVEYLQGKIPDSVAPLLKCIKPTTWKTWKTEAINFKIDFLWLDDYIFEKERQELVKHNAMENLILIDLKEHPNQLLDIIKRV